jgi:hypothetical protein
MLSDTLNGVCEKLSTIVITVDLNSAVTTVSQPLVPGDISAKTSDGEVFPV